MKKIIITAISLLIFCSTYAQKAAIEKEIKMLEEKVIQAVLEKDSVTLSKIWDPGFMVNAPVNRVVIGQQIKMVMSGMISYSSFKAEIEQILIKGDIVITMGSETVVPVMGNPKGGQIVKRRFTHIWVKENGSWKLIARHSNEVCPQ